MRTGYGRNNIDTFKYKEGIEVVVIGNLCCWFDDGILILWSSFLSWQEPKWDKKHNRQEVSTLNSVDNGFARFCPGHEHSGENSKADNSKQGNG